MEIQTFIAGYVDMVQSQDRGLGISQASDYLQGQLDLTDQSMLTRRDHLVASGAVGAAYQGFIAVPPGYIYRIQALGARWTTAAGVVLTQGIISILTPSPSNPGLAFPISDGVDLAASSVAVRTIPQRGLWLPPGTTIGVSAASIVGAPQCQLNLWADRLKV